MPVIRTDPLRNFKFRVQIVPEVDSGLNTLAAGIGNLGFAQMSGIAVTNEVIPYREGGMNTHPHKMVGQSDFAPVSLARGVFPGTQGGNGKSLAAWQLFMHTWQGGHEVGGAAPVTGGGHPMTGNVVQSVDTSEYRCTVRRVWTCLENWESPCTMLGPVPSPSVTLTLVTMAFSSSSCSCTMRDSLWIGTRPKASSLQQLSV